MATNATDKTTTDAPTALRDRAQEYYHDAYHLGTCAAGAHHFFSPYHDAIVRFDPDGEVTTLEFPEANMLPAYVEHVAEEVGGWDELRYDNGSLVDRLAAVLEADR